MSKKIISKVGKRHRPEIDMMEYIQTTENQEFDLDKDYIFTTCYKPVVNTAISVPPTGGSGVPVKKKYPKDAEVDIEQNGEFTEIIED